MTVIMLKLFLIAIQEVISRAQQEIFGLSGCIFPKFMSIIIITIIVIIMIVTMLVNFQSEIAVGSTNQGDFIRWRGICQCAVESHGPSRGRGNEKMYVKERSRVEHPLVHLLLNRM